ncbi:phosphotransferase family protein [Gorillibacterium massiliense]|uniref:phosphotransferase family protein n=1 Tax=Gorillibacterium massiliense TaxID=1280390 RepID=UPI0004B0D9FF|nr:phosphotransferase [Gorillibacterium massiliense]
MKNSEIITAEDLAAIRKVPGSADWQWIEPLLKGWSSDRKFEVVDGAGEKRLLRLSDGSHYEGKLGEFAMIRRANRLPFSMSRAVDFGRSPDSGTVYMLLDWVEGEPLEDVLPSFSSKEQYAAGYEAGGILRQIHRLPLEPGEISREEWTRRMSEKMRRRMRQYEECSYRVEGDEIAAAYVEEQIGLLGEAELVYHHGDYHLGNLIWTPDRHIGVIDFNRWDCGDYAEEFYKVQSFDREVSVPFARGKLDGYFGGPPPEAFWRRQALYVAYASLFSIVWAIPFGAEEIAGMQERCRLALEDYDGFRRLVPKWYEPRE